MNVSLYQRALAVRRPHHSSGLLPYAAALAALTACFSSTALRAQDASDTQQGAQLEEIVVTAERRVSNIQDIPIAVTALTGDKLQDKAVTRLDDLQFASPSLSIVTGGLTQQVNIRGVGLASGSAAVSNGVATYIDGLFQPPIVATNSFYDIGDVQVLRGPQGTFVGSNSTGGAIFINSRNPQLDDTEGYVEVGGGDYDSRSAQGALNLPLGNALAARVAVNYAKRDSFYDDHGAFHNDAGSLDEVSGRVGILWEPSDAFQALLKAETSSKETGGYAYRPIPTTLYAAGRTGDIRDLNYDTPTRNDENADIYGLELKAQAFGGITVRSMSGYQDKDIRNLYDLDATSLASALRTRDQYVRERQVSEELNIISPLGQRMDWVVGAYYQHNKIDVDLFDRVGAALPSRQFVPTEKTTKGYFGQIGYKVTPAFEVQLGLRYSEYRSESPSGAGLYRSYGAPATPGGTLSSDLSGAHEDSEPTGKISANWKINDDHLLYGFVARGYKAGGFNSATSQFDPETVLDYELGWKGTLLNDRLRTSLGAFRYDYEGFQATVIDVTSGRSGVTNVADATIQGVEFQVEASFAGVRVDGSVSYVDSELSSITFVNTRQLPGTNLGPQCAAGQTTGCFDYTPYLRTNSGGVNLFAPRTTYNAGAQYSFAVSSRSTLTPRVNYGYVASQYTNLLYDRTTDLLAARGLWSALLTYAQDPVDVQLYGTNLSDKEYVTGQNGNNEFYGAPREYGVRMHYRF